MTGSSAGRAARASVGGAVVAALAAAALAALLVAIARALPTAAGDFATVKAFNFDEALIGAILKKNLAEGTLDPHLRFEHGNLYRAIAYGAARARGAVSDGEVSERSIVLLLRGISFAAYVGFLAVGFRLLRRLRTDRGVALLGVLFVASLPELSAYSILVHPDLLQVFGLGCAVYFMLAGGDRRRNAYVASAFCGLAMATKFGGFFLLPFLPVPALLALPAHERVRRGSAIVFGCAVVFLAVFAAANPFAVTQYREFGERLGWTARTVAEGWEKAESANPFRWFPVLAAEFGRFGFPVAVAGFLVFVAGLRGAPPSGGAVDAGTRSARRTLAAYVVFSSVLVFLTVRIREIRHVFFVLPFFAFAAFVGLSDGIRRLARPVLRDAALAALSVVVLASAAPAIARAWRLPDRADSPVLAAGKWLAGHASRDARIYGDFYTYGDSGFTDYRVGLLVESLPVAHGDPEARFVVFGRAGIGRVVWKRPGTRFADGVWDIDRDHPSAARLEAQLRDWVSPRWPWRPVYENEEVVVYERPPGGGSK